MLRFMIGTDEDRLSGAKVERWLKVQWDIADFEVVPVWDFRRLLMGGAGAVQARAEEIATHIQRTHEAAEYYIGISRGYDSRVLHPNACKGSASVCFDLAVVVDKFGEKLGAAWLNAEHAALRSQGYDVGVHNDLETQLSLLVFTSAYCKEVVLV